MQTLLIIGAGPVGLTLAAELTRFGVPVRIVDKLEAPAPHSKALVIWPRSLELLEKGGLSEKLVAAGRPTQGMSVYETLEKRLAHVTFDDLPSPYPYVLCIPQNHTERVLSEHLQDLGIEVERSLELVALRQQEHGVVATLRGPEGQEEEVSTPYLLACDGGRSSTRHLLGVKLEGQTVDQEFAMADVEVKGLPLDDEVLSFVSSRGVCGAFPLETTGRYRLMVLREEPGSGPEAVPPSLDDMRQELTRMGLGALQISDPSWLAAFRVNERCAASYQHGRVFLCGDAAHVHSPVGGQGMNTGMQDAINLAWKLAYVLQGKLPAHPWLESYSLERQPIGAEVVSKTSRARSIVTFRHPVAHAIRSRVVSWLTSFDFVRHKISAETAELNVKYPHSPINREVHPGHAAWLLGHGVHPGDRAPDGEVSPGLHLFDLLRDGKFHLLAFPGLTESDSHELDTILHWAQQQDWLRAHRIESHELHRKYGATSTTLYLVRPDSYVAFRSQPAVLLDLHSYVRELGLAN